MVNDEAPHYANEKTLAEIAADIAGSSDHPDGYLIREGEATPQQRKSRDANYIAKETGRLN